MTDLKTQAHYIKTSAERLHSALANEPPMPRFFLLTESAILLRRVFRFWWSVRFRRKIP